MRTKRKLRRNIFIACEGTNTERIYFQALREEPSVIEEFAVTVYPDETTGNPTSHALGLVRLAQEKMDEFDEVWAVFDKDGYTGHVQTFAEANTPINGKIVNIAFSSIAFEQWVLLHFTRSNVAYAKSAGITAQLTGNNYFPGYAKKAYIDTYSTIKDRTIIAIENAAWLRHQLMLQGVLPNTPIYDTNPYTDTDTLVKRLLGISEDVCWVSPGQVIAIGNISFSAVVSTATTITVTITNNGPQALIYNVANLNLHFYLFDAARNQSFFTIAVNTQVNPGDTNDVILTSAIPVQPGHLNISTGSHRIMMEL